MTTTDQALLDDYMSFVTDGDRNGAVRCVLDQIVSGLPLAHILRHVLVPAQEKVGELWQGNLWSVADEHVATAITDAALAALAPIVVSEPKPATMALACPLGEWHSLPARMFAESLREQGIEVAFLGASTPPDHLKSYLTGHPVTALGLSCSVPLQLPAAIDAVGVAHEVGIPVVVGGRAFAGNPERALAVGADLYAADAADVVLWLETAVEGIGPLRSANLAPEHTATAEAREAITEATLEELMAMWPEMRH